MLHHSFLRLGNLGSSRLGVSEGASRQTNLSCSRTRSAKSVSTIFGRDLMCPLTMDVLTNHRELHIESNNVRASCIRFWKYVRVK